ncbi:hypothetical protein [Gellertiella hungarica]|uniref:Uncharacterized protein n=1 Tax=Gellertiella hungarica TaxID=1572859 RepID=A0A7W6J1Y0_9HYPH|nr:hypothetical protein [Gellertiella hungarica]MBB4063268.1 hypothetical protein [Gellertiella hungarica]
MTINVVTERFTSRMLALHSELNRIARQFEPMPDDAMDSICEAISVVGRAIIDAPITAEQDIANKFRFAAVLIEYDAGDHADEPAALSSAISDLVAFRNDIWNAEIGGKHPFYAEAI